MYLILDDSDTIVAISPILHYVKTQQNGATTITEKNDATAVYATATDLFYHIRATVPGDKLYHALYVGAVPADVVPYTWSYQGRRFVPASKEARICVFKEKLAATDYKISKCAEYQLVGQPLPYDVAALHLERQTLRDEINTLENGAA